MKRRSVLLAALLALTAAPLLSGPAASGPGGPGILTNQNISIEKLPGSNIDVIRPPGPYVLATGHTAKFTNNTSNTVTVRSFNASNVQIVTSGGLAPGANFTFTQSTAASLISYFTVTDTKPTSLQAEVYSNQVPGIGGPALIALAILLLGSAAWALTRRGTQTA